MKRLLILALFCCAIPVLADSAFTVTNACQSENGYVVAITLRADVTGVLISPSHSATLETFGENVQVTIPLENEWAEIRAIGINPAPIEMLALENLAACETGENEANQAEFVINALMQYAEAIQEWGE